MPTEDTKKPAAKVAAKAAPAKAAVKAAKAAPKAEAKPATPVAAKPPVPAKKQPTGATVTVRQVHSGAGRGKVQQGTLLGLGLGVMHRSRTLEDTPSVRGMINRVKHLVTIEGEAKSKTGTGQ